MTRAEALIALIEYRKAARAEQDKYARMWATVNSSIQLIHAAIETGRPVTDPDVVETATQLHAYARDTDAVHAVSVYFALIDLLADIVTADRDTIVDNTLPE